MTYKFAFRAVSLSATAALLLLCVCRADFGPGGGSVDPDDGVNSYIGMFNPELRVQVSPVNGGSVSAFPSRNGDWKYRYGDTVTVKAVPSSGYAFKEWSGALTGSVDSLRIVMDGKKSLTAYFVQTYKLTVAVNPSGSGIVKRDPDKAYYASGDSVTVEAIDSDGYVFDAWSDGVKSSVRVIAIFRNETLTAYFKIK